MARRPRGSAVFNPVPNPDIDPNASREAALAEFASRLQNLLVGKGMNQSELARSASARLPKGSKPMGRDSVSQYIRGLSFPSPVNLRALAEALGVEPAQLLPTRGIKSAADNAAAVSVRDLGDGYVWLRINERVEWSKMVKVLTALKGDEG